jgi:hypothetical protein
MRETKTGAGETTLTEDKTSRPEKLGTGSATAVVAPRVASGTRQQTIVLQGAPEPAL